MTEVSKWIGRIIVVAVIAVAAYYGYTFKTASDTIQKEMQQAASCEYKTAKGKKMNYDPSLYVTFQEDMTKKFVFAKKEACAQYDYILQLYPSANSRQAVATIMISSNGMDVSQITDKSQLTSYYTSTSGSYKINNDKLKTDIYNIVTNTVPGGA